jgi:hypothetical protein
MGCVLSLRRSEYSVVWLPINAPLEATIAPADDPKNDPLRSNEASPGTPDRRPMSRFPMAFCIGVIAILAWQSCSDAARRLVGTSSLQFGGLAAIAHTTPDTIAPATVATPSLDKHLAAIEENVDQRAASQQRTNLVEPAFAQEQIRHDFDSLHQAERHTISKMSVPLPRPAPAETRNYASRPATTTPGAGPNAHHAVTPSTSVGSSSPSPVASMRLDARRKRTQSSAPALRSSEPFGQSLISAGQRLMLALSRITGIQL